MASVVITEAFTGYPNGKKREFVENEEPADLPTEFITLIVEKGHARRKTAAKPATTNTKANRE